MSYPFQVAGSRTLIWDPGIGVGRTYAAFAEQTGDLLGLPTGLVYSERLGGSDVDLEVFQRFTQKLYDDYCNTNNFILHNILRGFLLASIVMLENGGGSIVRGGGLAVRPQRAVPVPERRGPACQRRPLACRRGETQADP
ncbi:DUF6086 family protein [Streptomyces sp. NPDC053755]|uniref:DUF6086 family protein n=1 Tax=Streptomyces sp. NPDC053755 TaxID=3155815 RepID=UPI00343E3ECF